MCTPTEYRVKRDNFVLFYDALCNVMRLLSVLNYRFYAEIPWTCPCHLTSITAWRRVNKVTFIQLGIIIIIFSSINKGFSNFFFFFSICLRIIRWSYYACREFRNLYHQQRYMCIVSTITLHIHYVIVVCTYFFFLLLFLTLTTQRREVHCTHASIFLALHSFVYLLQPLTLHYAVDTSQNEPVVIHIIIRIL